MFKLYTTDELAAFLLQHPGKTVVIEDTDCVLIAHGQINVAEVSHVKLGDCISLSCLPNERRRNFCYKQT